MGMAPSTARCNRRCLASTTQRGLSAALASLVSTAGCLPPLFASLAIAMTDKDDWSLNDKNKDNEDGVDWSDDDDDNGT